MKILFCYNMGFGNVIQQIPLYVSLEEHFGRVIDCCYIMQFDGDDPKNASCTPNPICPAENYVSLESQFKDYDYIVKPPYIYDGSGDFFREHIDNMRELDSEIVRNGRICEFLGIPYTLHRNARTKALSVPQRYCVLHNGAQAGWDNKKYDKFEEVAWRLQKKGIECVSVGVPSEYIFGTTNYTGLTWRETAHVIKSATGYLGTDTGTYHLAGIFETPGVAIFTMTSIGKNWDKDFHHTIKPIQRTDLPEHTCPCQKGYTWMHSRSTCKDPKCKDISAELIVNTFMEQING